MPASAEEVAQHESRKKAADEVHQGKADLASLESEITKDGIRPEGKTAVSGETLLDTFTPYGGGERWVVQPDAIWFIRNNSGDGDNWDRNNVETGGAGAIGFKVPKTPELEARLRSAVKRASGKA